MCKILNEYKLTNQVFSQMNINILSTAYINNQITKLEHHNQLTYMYLLYDL